MIDNQKISVEVNDMIEQFLAGTGRCETRHVVMAIVSSWSPPGGPDEEKWMHCAYEAVAQKVGSAIKRFDVKAEEEDEQLILPGYEKLHRAYRVKGRLVRVDQLTVAEALHVLSELERCETGLRIHKNELQRYIDEVLIPNGGSGDN